jgi:hypothetical protein
MIPFDVDRVEAMMSTDSFAIVDESMDGMAAMLNLRRCSHSHTAVSARYVVFADTRAHDGSVGPRHGGLRSLERLLVNDQSRRCALLVVGCLEPEEYGSLAYLAKTLPFIRLPIASRAMRPLMVPRRVWQQATNAARKAVSHRRLRELYQNLVSHNSDTPGLRPPALRLSALWGAIKQWFQHARAECWPAAYYLRVDGIREWTPRLLASLRPTPPIPDPLLRLTVEQTATFCELAITQYLRDISIIEAAAHEGLPGDAGSLIDATNRIDSCFAELEEVVVGLSAWIEASLPEAGVGHADDRFF